MHNGDDKTGQGLQSALSRFVPKGDVLERDPLPTAASIFAQHPSDESLDQRTVGITQAAK